MKLVRCDQCGKVLRPRETWSAKFEGTVTSEIVYSFEDEYYTFEEVQVDLCRGCMTNILKPIFPKRKFFEEEDYKKAEVKT